MELRDKIIRQNQLTLAFMYSTVHARVLSELLYTLYNLLVRI